MNDRLHRPGGIPGSRQRTIHLFFMGGRGVTRRGGTQWSSRAARGLTPWWGAQPPNCDVYYRATGLTPYSRSLGGFQTYRRRLRHFIFQQRRDAAGGVLEYVFAVSGLLQRLAGRQAIRVVLTPAPAPAHVDMQGVRPLGAPARLLDALAAPAT